MHVHTMKNLVSSSPMRIRRLPRVYSLWQRGGLCLMLPQTSNPMKLKRVHATEFQSIRDSNSFDIGAITCLVGKNEAGKSTVLQALYRLNPIIEAHGRFDITDDYPRADVEDYRIDVETKKRQPATVIRATFKLDNAEMEPII